MDRDKKRVSKEEKRLKFIREMRNRRNEAKKEYDNGFPGTAKKFRLPKSRK